MWSEICGTVFYKVDWNNNLGKVIGRDGKIARSIRTIVKSASAKLNKKYIVKIGERD